MSGKVQRRKRRGGSKRVRAQRMKTLVRKAKKGKREFDQFDQFSSASSAPGAYTKPTTW